MANIKVKFGAQNQLQITSPATLRNTTGAGVAANRFDMLADVVENSPPDGAVVQYRASDDKYIVQALSLDSTNLDGGSF